MGMYGIKSSSIDNASILARIKEGYLIWVSIVPHIPRGARYTIGARIENKFLDLLELSYISYFSEKEEKLGRVTECISILDTLKFLILVSWEAKFIANKHYEELALKLDDIGKNVWGLEKKLGASRKEKPRLRRGKEILSKTENKLIVKIPMIIRVRPIAIQPETIIIAFQLEHVRIAIGISLV